MTALLNTLGVIDYRLGNWRAAIKWLEQSAENGNGGGSYDRFFLAMAHWQLGNQQTAREFYRTAVDWMDKNQPTNQELLGFRSEAEHVLGITQLSPPSSFAAAMRWSQTQQES